MLNAFLDQGKSVHLSQEGALKYLNGTSVLFLFHWDFNVCLSALYEMDSKPDFFPSCIHLDEHRVQCSVSNHHSYLAAFYIHTASSGIDQ